MPNQLPVLKRIGFKISLMVTAVMLLGIGLADMLMVRHIMSNHLRYEQLMRTEIKSKLEKKAGFAAFILASGSVDAVLTYNYSMLDSFVDELKKDPDIQSVDIFDVTGKLLTRPSTGLKSDADGVIVAESEIRAAEHVVGLARVKIGKERLTEAVTEVQNRNDEEYDQTRRLFFITMGILAVGTMGGVLLMVNHVVVRPLQGLVMHMMSIRSRELVDIPVSHSEDEIGQLIVTYNRLSTTMVNYDRELKDKMSDLERSQATLRDLNESLEQRVYERTRELAATNEEIRSFVYIVSHDLRAPLINIKGFSDVLYQAMREFTPLVEKYVEHMDANEKQRTEALLKNEIPQAIGFIGSSVTRMDSLINCILKLSRLGRIEFKPELVHTGDLVQFLLNTLAHQIDMHRAQVTIGRLPDFVIDRTAIEQVFGNLLDNALKYLEPDRPGKIEITAEHTAEEIIFAVRDNGRGMTKEDIPRAFEIFRRVGRQDVPGEGMGLAYVKTLVRGLGGRIWCESEPGAGTTFSVALPGSSGDVGGQISAGGRI